VYYYRLLRRHTAADKNMSSLQNLQSIKRTNTTMQQSRKVI